MNPESDIFILDEDKRIMYRAKSLYEASYKSGASIGSIKDHLITKEYLNKNHCYFIYCNVYVDYDSVI